MSSIPLRNLIEESSFVGHVLSERSIDDASTVTREFHVSRAPIA